MLLQSLTTKFMKNIIFPAMLLMLAGNIQAQASQGDEGRTARTEAKSDIIKLSYGPGMSVGDMRGMETDRSYSNVLTLALDYEHVFRSGIGVALNVSQNHYHVPSINAFYVGASVLYSRTTTQGWRWEGGIGAGYAANDLMYKRSRKGYGVLSQLGVTYQLSKHWGVGADLRYLTTNYRKQHELRERFGQYGLGSCTCTFGLRYAL